MRIPAIVSVILLSACITSAQNPQSPPPALDMSSHDMSKTSAKPDTKDMSTMDAQGGAHAMHSMEGHHMDMGPHMKMTPLHDPKPGDEQRAQQVVQTARRVAEKYKDYHTAVADNFQIFLPNVPQKMYHFTNYSYAFEAATLCLAPADRKREALGPHAKFGLEGSIATKEECDANGGTFRPLVFNWMVHLYPLKKAEAEIWAVDRGHNTSHGN